MIGEMSMAPIITAAELTFRPSDAIIVAKISTQRFTPRNTTPLLMAATTSSRCALSSSRLKRPRRNSRISPTQSEKERFTLCVSFVFSVSTCTIFHLFLFVRRRLPLRFGFSGQHDHELPLGVRRAEVFQHLGDRTANGLFEFLGQLA